MAHLQDLTRQLGLTTRKSGPWKQRLHHTHWLLFRYRDAELRVSIRLENVTAIDVLESLLNVNGLRMEADPSTKILRITL